MPKFDEATRARARALRDAILSEVEDRTDPRYLALMEEVAAEAASPGERTERRAWPEPTPVFAAQLADSHDATFAITTFALSGGWRSIIDMSQAFESGGKHVDRRETPDAVGAKPFTIRAIEPPLQPE